RLGQRLIREKYPVDCDFENPPRWTWRDFALFGVICHESPFSRRAQRDSRFLAIRKQWAFMKYELTRSRAPQTVAIALVVDEHFRVSSEQFLRINHRRGRDFRDMRGGG